MLIKMAWRNILRNRRRSLATILALTIGTTAILLFGGFIASIFYGLQSNLFSEKGHIHIYSKGYMDYGAIEPENYIIHDYPELINYLNDAPILANDIRIITPQVKLSGIAGVIETDNSKLFSGLGVIPEDLDNMRKWDNWHMGVINGPSGLSDQGEDAVIAGFGMTRMLGLCSQFKLFNCHEPPAKKNSAMNSVNDMKATSFAENGFTFEEKQKKSQDVQLNLLVSSTTGLPNIESVHIIDAQQQGLRFVDDMYMLLNFKLASRLVFGNDISATQIVVQINDADRINIVKANIQTLLTAYSDRKNSDEYEVLTITEVDPSFGNVLKMFSFIFGVVLLFLGIVISSAVANTINMAVMERVKETGTIRALGFKRNFVARMFIVESIMLGLLGMITGTIVATILAYMINTSGLSWTPPSNASPLSIQLFIFKSPLQILIVIAFNLFFSAFASIIPAVRAARMNIVTALNHN